MRNDKAKRKPPEEKVPEPWRIPPYDPDSGDEVEKDLKEKRRQGGKNSQTKGES